MLVECPQCYKPREVKRKPLNGVVCRNCKNENYKLNPKTEWFRVCKNCNDTKKVKTKRESENKLCRSCYDNENIKIRTRICVDCGDKKVCETTRDAKSLRCRSCASKKIKRVRVKHYYFCPDCSDIKITHAKRFRSKCTGCNKKQIKKAKGYFDLNELQYKIIAPLKRYFRICPECGDTKQMKRKAGSGIKKCRTCSNKEIIAKRKKKVATIKKPRVKKKKRYSKVGTDGAKRNKVTVKFQTVDLDTLEDIDLSKRKRKKKESEFPQIPRERELQMQEEWLKKNKVKEK